MEPPPAAETAGFSSWQLVATSATPTLIVCILGAVGAVLAHKGVLNGQGCQTVAKLCIFVFTPALTFSKLAQAISLQSIAHLWPLLANTTVNISVGLGAGLLLARLTGTPPELRSIVMCTVAFGNVGNLPLVFVSTLCHDRQALFFRSLGADCEHRGIAYTAFDIAAATLWQFTLGISLIRRAAAQAALAGAGPELGPCADGLAAEPARAGSRASDNRGLSVRAPLPLRKEPTLSNLLKGRQGSRSGSAGSSPREEEQQGYQHHQQHLLQHRQLQQGQQQQRHGHLPPPTVSPWHQPSSHPLAHQPQPQPCPPSPRLPASPFEPALNGATAGVHAHFVVELQPVVAFQPHPVPPQPQLLGWSPGRPHPSSSGNADEADDEDTAALLGSAGKKGSSAGRAAGPAAGSGSLPVRWARSAWRSMRAVDWGAAFPLPSQAAILGITVGCIPPLKALLYSPHPPLRVLAEALDTLGHGLIPTAIPLLGAALSRGPGASHLPLRVTVAVLLTRLILLPALLTALVVLVLHLRLFTSPDPMFLLTLLLSNATPTAIIIQTFTVLYRVGEGEMATMLFWQYIGAMFTLPACMWVFLRIINTWQ
ncbi:hypothetical protein ABPG75_004286 [Micractinium tetrahymenae]